MKAVNLSLWRSVRHDWGDDLDSKDYIGTVLLDEGTLVLHYFILEADSDREALKGMNLLCDMFDKMAGDLDNEFDNAVEEDQGDKNEIPI